MALKKRSPDDIYNRPGFMVRRAHQIAVSLFEGDTATIDISPTQYAMIYFLSIHPDTDQITIGNMLGIDRSTTALVAKILEKNEYLVRKVSPADGRRKLLKLTRKGHALLKKVEHIMEDSKLKLLSPLSDDEAATFLNLLKKVIDAHNSIARTPIRQKPDPNP